MWNICHRYMVKNQISTNNSNKLYSPYIPWLSFFQFSFTLLYYSKGNFLVSQTFLAMSDRSTTQPSSSQRKKGISFYLLKVRHRARLTSSALYHTPPPGTNYIFISISGFCFPLAWPILCVPAWVVLITYYVALPSPSDDYPDLARRTKGHKLEFRIIQTSSRVPDLINHRDKPRLPYLCLSN